MFRNFFRRQDKEQLMEPGEKKAKDLQQLNDSIDQLIRVIEAIKSPETAGMEAKYEKSTASKWCCLELFSSKTPYQQLEGDGDQLRIEFVKCKVAFEAKARSYRLDLDRNETLPQELEFNLRRLFVLTREGVVSQTEYNNQYLNLARVVNHGELAAINAQIYRFIPELMRDDVPVERITVVSKPGGIVMV